jgi:acetylornithine deacetylase/succinyl-diaminopimelate desuccinylase-like protein
MKHVVEEHADLFADVRHAVSEGGGFSQWHRGRRLVPIGVAEKQRCLIRATVRGSGGHPASVVRGSASANLGRFLSLLASRRLPSHITPVVRAMFDAMSGALPIYERLAVRGLLRPALTDRVLRLLGADGLLLAPMFHNTATPTGVGGGAGTNVIPTELSVELDGRVLPGLTPAQLLAEIDALAPGLATLELVREEPAVSGEPDMSLYPLLVRIARESEPGCVPFPVLLPGYTDARWVSKLGIQTYGFLPMSLPRHITMGLIHGADERVPSDVVDYGADRLVRLIHSYSG